MFSKKELIACVFVVALPFLLQVLWKSVPATAAIPYFMYQIYYAPLGLWLSEPLFGHNTELGIIVYVSGAVVTAVAYGTALLGIGRVIKQMRKRATD